MIQSCRQHLSREALKDVFCLTYDRMRRYQGSWHVERQNMFPHYIFLESENEKQLREELEEYRDFVTLLEDKESLIPVRKEEEQFLQGMCEEAHHFGMSRGYIQDGQTCVTEGPLRGRERLIRKIDRHKRLARLVLPYESMLCKRDSENSRQQPDWKKEQREMVVGLEIISKI